MYPLESKPLALFKELKLLLLIKLFIFKIPMAIHQVDNVTLLRYVHEMFISYDGTHAYLTRNNQGFRLPYLEFSKFKNRNKFY